MIVNPTDPEPTVELFKAIFGNSLPVSFIAGPCQMESRDQAMEIASELVDMSKRLGFGLVFKASFDKANRTSISGRRGLGLEKSIQAFADIRQRFGIAVLTDVHEREQCAVLAEVVDVLQIPAFLCRQTDLLLAAAATGRVVNIKKGQFLAPWDVKNIIEKVCSGGNSKVLVTERGTSFGYNTLVTDFRSLPILASYNAPIVF